MSAMIKSHINYINTKQKMVTDTCEKNLDLQYICREKLSSLDGWRAISIIMVYVQHSSGMYGWPQSLNNKFISAIGGVGVRFFFVISGFLITWLLLKEVSKYGRVSLSNFFIRRVLRIFPVLLFYFISAYVLSLLGVLNIGLFEYLASIFFMCDLINCGHGLGHLWSLGVEEKFYLFWPFVFICLFKVRLVFRLIAIGMLIVNVPFLRFYFESSASSQSINFFNNHSFFIIYDGLVIGCLGSILLYYHAKSLVGFLYDYKYLLNAIGVILIITPGFFWYLKSLSSLKPLQDSLQCIGFLMLLLQSVAFPDFFLYKILNTKVLVYIGSISYSLYIWMGIFELPNLYNNSFFKIEYIFPVWIIFALFFSHLSFKYLETPFLKLKKPIIKFFGIDRG